MIKGCHYLHQSSSLCLQILGHLTFSRHLKHHQVNGSLEKLAIFYSLRRCGFGMTRAASAPCEGHQGDAARLFTEVVGWENRSGINWKRKKKGRQGHKIFKARLFPVKSPAVEQSPGRLCCLYPSFPDPAG